MHQSGPPLRSTADARAVVHQRMQGGPLDVEACEQEPIRVPGSIQPHGALLAIEIATQTVVAASANAGDFLGVAAVLGRSAEAILPPVLVAALAELAGVGPLSSINPSRIAKEVVLAGPATPAVDCWAHAAGDCVVLELEPAAGSAAPDRAADCLLDRILTQMRDVSTLSALNEVLVGGVFELTGYERVLIYRFDADWNGTTVAERKVESWDEPFLGLRFPASDIPRQARELYRENLLRLMPSRDAEPVPLLHTSDARAANFDLSGARLRSQSPIHLEYQRNIGVDGAMSASIIKRGQLWGLLVGHHRGPHRLSGDAAAVLSILVRAYAMRLYEVEDDALRDRRTRQDQMYARLLEQMAAGDDFVDALVGGPVPLHEVFEGNGAAILRGDRVYGIGQTPPESVVRAIAEALRAESPRGVVVTDRLQPLLPEDIEAIGVSGVLALPVRDDAGSMILWFRPEVASTVVWAGDPRKSMVIESDGARALPRRSFERWVEERRGYSVPWEPFQQEAAGALGFAIDEVILRHARKVKALNEQLDQVGRLTAQQSVTEAALKIALQEKDSLLAQKDFLLSEVDHRIRNSLTLISSILQLQARSVDPSARQQFLDASRRVTTVAQVHQRLYQSGKLQMVELKQYFGALLADISESVAEANETLEVDAADTELAADDAVALGLIVNELVTNAFKHGRIGAAPLNVKVTVEREINALQVVVEDDGGRLAEGFDITKANGLGMRLVSGLLQRLGGGLQIDTGERRTRFVIRIPDAP